MVADQPRATRTRKSRKKQQVLPGAFEQEPIEQEENPPPKERVVEVGSKLSDLSSLSDSDSSVEVDKEIRFREEDSLTLEPPPLRLGIPESDFTFTFSRERVDLGLSASGLYGLKVLNHLRINSQKQRERAEKNPARRLQLRRDTALKHFTHNKLRVRKLPPVAKPPGEPTMAEPPKRDSWRDLTDEQKEQVATEKGKTHKFPELFQGNSEDEWLCWFDDIEAAFVAKKITMDEAKIFCAIRSMGYTLRKEVETLESSKGRSWEEFRKEIEKEWTIDAKYGSQEALKRVIEEFATMSLQVSESRYCALNIYAVKSIHFKAKRVQNAPAGVELRT
ncbi:hypothetical protein PQX77_012583 [Marasmius sp. AFHP31]|nr:hypothetical protein PQX77_012583 [Marasmius sp. AFHP31]